MRVISVSNQVSVFLTSQGRSLLTATMVPTLALLSMSHAAYAADASADNTPVVAPVVNTTNTTSTEIIVITAQKMDKDIVHVAGTIHLIDQNDIQRAGRLPQLTDVLTGIPGVFTYNTGGMSGGSTFRLRGASTSGTQIIRDGIPFNDPSTTQGSPNMSLSSAAGVRSIEVALGSQSTLYGSKAIGGVINMVALRATENNEGFIRLGVASFATRQVDVQATGPINDKLGYAIGYTSIDSDGVSEQTTDDDGDPTGYEDDAYNKNGLYLRADYQLSEAVSLSLIRDESRGEAAFDGFAAPDDSSPVTTIRSTKMQVNADVTLPENITIQLRLAETVYDRSVPNASFGNKGYDGDESFVSVSGFHDINESVIASLGYDARTEELTLEPVFGTTQTEQSAYHKGLWAQLAYAADALEVDMSVRSEEHSIAQSATTWHLAGAGFFHDESIKVHSSVGTAFRAPSLFELNYGATQAAQLNPEESLGLEIGVTYFYHDQSSVGITAWQTDYTNRIVYTGTFGVDDRYENDESGADVRGYDVFGNYLFAAQHIDVSASVTLQNPEEDSALESRLPETMSTLSLSWSPQAHTWVSGEVQYTGRRKASSFASRDELDSYTLVNISCGYQVHDKIIIDAQIRNLLDEVYLPAEGFSGKPRYVSVGFTAEF